MSVLFEVSWEVCNCGGDVFSALCRKASHAVGQFGDNYFLIGPLLNSSSEFQETTEPDFALIRQFTESAGIECRFGRWIIAGEPRVILIDYHNLFDINQLLHQLWQDFGVDSLGAEGDYLGAVRFGRACGEVINSIHQALFIEEDEIIVQCHQWISAYTVLYLKKELPHVGTVFSEHSTVLGQAVSNAGRDLSAELDWLNVFHETETFRIKAKHNLEGAAVRVADCVTAVGNLVTREVQTIFQRQPVLVHDGLNASDKPNHLEKPENSQEVKHCLRQFSSDFLQKDLPLNTRFILTAGEYRFGRIGLNLVIDSLAQLEQRLVQEDQAVVAFIVVPANHCGVIKSVYQRVYEGEKDGGVEAGILTHQLVEEGSDSILNSCRERRLFNRPGNKVHPIFIPATLDGHDGVLNISYQTLLLGCDVGLFPSLYEPWGYTALESAEMALPTIVSTQSGFGQWLLSLSHDERGGLWLLDRHGKTYHDSVGDLTGLLQYFVNMSQDEWFEAARAARRTALRAEWIVFYREYKNAYQRALDCVRQRSQVVDTSKYSEEQLGLYKGSSRHRQEPLFRSFNALAPLPKELEGLHQIAHNLWWSWDADAQRLFSSLDPRLWQEVSRNPVLFLNRISKEILQQKMSDADFLKLYRDVYRRFVDYVDDQSFSLKRNSILSKDHPVVYLSMEYGLHESLPIYSGGLGILSGDHLKSASDHNIPLVGVGLFYRRGYFSQTVDRDGNQVAHYPRLDCAASPVEVLHAADGSEARIFVDLDGRQVGARVWAVKVGRIKLLLMDSDIEENEPEDRQLTAQLYGGDRRMRLSQEILLGIGGVKLVLDVMGLNPSVWHLNEGHVAFSLLERCRRFMQEGYSFPEAREAVKATSVFTTHTPVPAGNEIFQTDLISHFLRDYVESWPLSLGQLLELGADSVAGAKESFSMTVLALKLSSRSNGVSKLHGKVCRQMWKNVWKGVNVEEIPISSITNGVHLQTWISPNIRKLVDQYTSVKWGINEDQQKVWLGFKSVPDEELWSERVAQKKVMIERLREKVMQDYARRGEDPHFIRDTLRQLSPYKLTLVFARRFATYKRPGLMVKDRERLQGLLNDSERPVQILVAGKAHPADMDGQACMRELIAISKLPEFRGRLLFIEEYDMSLGRLLTSGADVWLNNPVRPHEASGTSGMKAAINATLNFSVLDGWWDEAYHSGVGWAIDPVDEVSNCQHQDELDFENMMNTLEHHIVPLYYERDENGLPRGWLQVAKNSVIEIGPLFSTHRMLRDYYSEMYYPTALRGQQLLANQGKKLRVLTHWKQMVGTCFSGVEILKVDVDGLTGDQISVGQEVIVNIQVKSPRLGSEEICVEFVYGLRCGDGFAEQPLVLVLECQDAGGSPNLLHYHGKVLVESPGSYVFSVRVVPTHPLLAVPQETGLVCWG